MNRLHPALCGEPCIVKVKLTSIALCVILMLSALSCAVPDAQNKTESTPAPALPNDSRQASSPAVENLSAAAGEIKTGEDEAMSVLTSAGDYDVAIEKARAALETAPSEVLREKLADAYMERAWFYKAKRLTTYALKDLLSAREAAPDYYLVYYDLGRFYNNQMMQSTAIVELGKCIRLRPDFAPAYNEKSASASRIYRWEEALADADKAIELNPDEALYYYTRSLAYRGLGKSGEAVADLQTAIELSRDPSLTDRARADLQQLKP